MSTTSSIAPTLKRAPDSTTGETLPAESGPVALIDPARGAIDDGPRYQATALLGEGGMGEVHLCRDRAIGRDVALKVLHQESAHDHEVRLRFEREARVQGQLEHPAIVPVYDLAIDPQGAPFFTMKRVRGATVADVLHQLSQGDAATTATWSRRKLLTAFSSVCLAVGYAHARGVLHRDLKPGNVMLGDFGEVYVLDWGLAKIAGATDLALTGEFRATKPGETQGGTILGTPGYMPPEQARGELDQLDERSDVWALGAILFEILTLQPLVPQTNVTEILERTRTGVDARASERSPERAIPPELESLCVRATALRREDRFGSALELQQALESYLAGDRDAERRRTLANAHAMEAERRAIDIDAPGNEGREARAGALRELGRALALDPDHERALAMMVRILVSPPKEMPAAAEEEHATVVHTANRSAAKMGALTLVGWFVAAPFLWWVGGLTYLLPLVPTTVCLVVSWLVSRMQMPTARHPLIIFGLNAITIATTSVILGPFILLPALAIASACMYFIQGTWRRGRPIVLAFTALAMFLPLVLEWTGVLPPSYAFRDGALVLLPRFTTFRATPTILLILVGHCALLFGPTYAIGAVADVGLATDRRLFKHLWQLRQIVPTIALPQGGGTT